MNTPELSSREQLVDALARHLDMTSRDFDTPGTTVTYRDDRAETGQVAIYRVGAHTILWADPALEGQIDDFADPSEAAELDTARDQLIDRGFELLAGSLMRIQDATAASRLASAANELTEATAEFRSVWMSDNNSDDRERIAEFASGCSDEDLEQADLEDLDEFEGEPIHGIAAADGTLVALAYATSWDWDPTFRDVGVIVGPDYRRRSLGVRAIAGLAANVAGQAMIPLYRHEQENVGSAALATRLGFEPVLTLCVLRRPPVE